MIWAQHVQSLETAVQRTRASLDPRLGSMVGKAGMHSVVGRWQLEYCLITLSTLSKHSCSGRCFTSKRCMRGPTKCLLGLFAKRDLSAACTFRAMPPFRARFPPAGGLLRVTRLASQGIHACATTSLAQISVRLSYACCESLACVLEVSCLHLVRALCVSADLGFACLPATASPSQHSLLP